MDEKRKKICVIKTPGYYLIMINGIILVALLLIGMIINFITDEIGMFVGEIFGSGFAIFMFRIIIDSLKKIQIYEDCICIHNTIIKYDEIESIKMVRDEYDLGMGKEENEKYLEITFKNGSIERFLLAHYSYKQNITMVNYIEQFVGCDVSQAKEFLGLDEAKDIRAIRILIAFIGIILVGAILLVVNFA